MTTMQAPDKAFAAALGRLIGDVNRCPDGGGLFIAHHPSPHGRVRVSCVEDVAHQLGEHDAGFIDVEVECTKKSASAFRRLHEAASVAVLDLIDAMRGSPDSEYCVRMTLSQRGALGKCEIVAAA